MSNKSVRIKINPGEEVNKYIKVKIDQDVDTLEILSLKIGQTDIYSSFNANFGVIFGKIVGNGGIPIPNCRVGIFIPLTEEDRLRPEIVAHYPYETVRDINRFGRKFNLLPRIASNSPFILPDEVTPAIPLGDFPLKEEVYSNDILLEIYKKYYKHTTISNFNGEFIIYGVPIGNYEIVCHADVTSIGKYSLTPASMVSQLGYSPNLFNGNRIKHTTDLDTAPNIELLSNNISVRSFWGSSENFEIGLTRNDFKLRTNLVSSFTVFGSAFTNGFRSTWGQNDINTGGDDVEELWRINDNTETNVSISTMRNGKIVIDVYYYPSSISDVDIDSGNVDTKEDIVLLDSSQYTSYIEDGQFILILPCNRRKVITDESGNEIVVSDTNPNGVFSEFRGMFFCRYGDELPLPTFDDIAGDVFNNHTFSGQRWKIKIPQTAPNDQCLNSGANEVYNENWRKQSFKFQASKIYSVSKFHHLDFRNGGPTSRLLNQTNLDPFWNVGIIVTDDDYSPEEPFNSTFQFPSNGATDIGKTAFGGDWLNFSLHFPVNTYFLSNNNDDTHSNLSATINNTSRHFYTDNTQKIVSNLINTKNYLRNDYNKTSFVEVPKEDLINILQNAPTMKGFKTTDAVFQSNPLIGSYQGVGSVKYFYRGILSADCIGFLQRNGIINI